MSFAGALGQIVGRYGDTVRLYRDGELLGEGRAVLRPFLEKKEQFTPTRLGVRRVERVLCLGEGALPFSPQPGETVVRQGEDAYDVVNVRAVMAGQELIYWRAVLVRRDEEES